MQLYTCWLLLFLVLCTRVNSRNVCGKELAEIVYTPSSYYYELGRRLEVEFRTLTPVIFTPQNATYIFEFEQKNEVFVRIWDGFYHNWKYEWEKRKVRYDTVYHDYSGIMRSMINIPGLTLVLKPNVKFAVYTFNLWGQDGKLLVVDFKFDLIPLNQG